jgi:signal peptidase I
MTSSSSVHSTWRAKLFWLGASLFVLGALLTFCLHRSWRTYTVHAVLSGSMGRAVPKGSLIFTEQQPQAAYVIGDVITFPLPSNPRDSVTHRIVRIEKGRTVLTQGDANPNGDGWNIPTDLIIGKVVLVVPVVGYLCMALQSVAGFLIFALTTLLLIVVPLITEAVRAWHRQQEGLAQ